VIARSSTWLRASEGGILRSATDLGALVEPGDRLGTISDPSGDREIPVEARERGVVVGRSSLPLVNEGDALFHIARFTAPEAVADAVEALDQASGPSPGVA
jgi:predicted deacylase